MSILNNTHATPRRHSGPFLRAKHLLPLIVLAGGWLLVASASAQSTEAENAKTGSIRGTVTDVGDDPVSDAAVVLHGPAG